MMTGDEVRVGIEWRGCVRRWEVDDVPVTAGELLERKGGAGEGIEAPLALDGSGEEDGFGSWCRGLLAGFLFWGQFGVGKGFDLILGKRCGFMEFYVVFRDLLEDEATLVGVGDERDVRLRRCAWGRVEMQDHVVREAGGEDERGAFNGEGHGGLE